MFGVEVYDVIVSVGGIVAMLFGAEIAVNSSVALAHKWRWPEWIAGLVLLALGTSLPELFISVEGALNGYSEMAVGNLMGSNAFNVGVVFGFCLLVSNANKFKTDMVGWGALGPLFLGSILIILVYDFDQESKDTGAWFGLLLLFLYIATMSLSIIYRRDASAEGRSTTSSSEISTALVGTKAIFGFALLAIGADYFIEGALGISNSLGWKEGLAGFLLAAVGTSLPELITSVIALKKGKGQAVFGNIVGSNAFNLLLTGGIVGIISKGFDLANNFILFMVVVNCAVNAALLVPILCRRVSILHNVFFYRLSGLILVVGYFWIMVLAYSM
mgnify:CR=1 FL=1